MDTEPGTRAAELRRESWLFLVSTYALISAGASLLAVTEMAYAYAFGAALLCLAHAVVVGPQGEPILSARAIQALGVAALLFALFHAYLTQTHISYAVGHFLILVQLIMLYGEHRLRHMHLLQATVVFEFLIAGIWALELMYLPFFLLTTVCLMANMIAVEMHRRGPGGVASVPPERAAPGLRDLLTATWLPAVMIFICTAVGFALLPRARWRPAGARLSPGLMTGFSENVSLREIGRLRQSEDIVFKARYYSVRGNEAVPHVPPRILMRGISLPEYRDGQWMRATLGWPRRSAGEGSSPFTARDIYTLRNRRKSGLRVLQRVDLVQWPGDVLFALYRPVQLGRHITYGRIADPLSHRLTPDAAIEARGRYSVVSDVLHFTPERLRRAGTPRPQPPWIVFWQLPPDIHPVLEETAAEIERLYRPQTDYDRVMAARKYLLDRSRFTYTLELPPYGTEDPIVAFLTETRRGSCEHFATALALLVRTWAIPSRLVIGFKGGELSAESQRYVFRQKHAHAWVEVFFKDLGWVEFDPTPPSSVARSDREESKGLLGRVGDRFDVLLSHMGQRLRRTWRANVIGYDRAQQKALLAGLARTAQGLITDATELVGRLVPGMPDLGSLQIVVLVVGLTGIAIALHLGAQWVQARLLKRGHPWARNRTVRFYEELLRILRRKGIPRRPSATPRELARAAATELGEANEEPRDLREAVYLLTDLYCRARFGQYGLTEADRNHIEEALRTLRAAKRSPRT
ncbi:MAG: DUF3488 and transglutaminase-like domain-containing protein [Candidatus Brocadiaceae bacterium]